MKHVTFLNSIIAEGQHCEAGSHKEIPERIANELIASGDAVAYKASAKEDAKEDSKPKK